MKPLTTTGDAPERFRLTIEGLEAPHDLNLSSVRSDRGEVYRSKDFCRWAATRHPPIDLQPSPAYTKEFNGLAERQVDILQGTAACMLLEARLPRTMMLYALHYAAHVKNRLYHSGIGDIPYRK